MTLAMTAPNNIIHITGIQNRVAGTVSKIRIVAPFSTVIIIIFKAMEMQTAAILGNTKNTFSCTCN